MPSAPPAAAPELCIDIKGNRSQSISASGQGGEFELESDGFYITGRAVARKVAVAGPGVGQEPVRYILGFERLHVENLHNEAQVSPSVQLRCAFHEAIGAYPMPGALESLLSVDGSIRARKGQVAADSICTQGIFVISRHGHVVQQALTTSGVTMQATEHFTWHRELHRMPPNLIGLRSDDWVHLRVVARLGAKETLQLYHPGCLSAGSSRFIEDEESWDSASGA